MHRLSQQQAGAIILHLNQPDNNRSTNISLKQQYLAWLSLVCNSRNL